MKHEDVRLLDSGERSRKTAISFKKPSRTKQSFKEETDINTIVKRFGLTGQLPVSTRQPMYGDFSNVHDFRTANDALIEARQSFESLPASVRKRFKNDPQEMMDFLEDAENREEAIKLGLIPKPAPVVKPVNIESPAPKEEEIKK